MTTTDYYNYFTEHLTDKDFKALSTFIQEHLGIRMPPAKKGMIEIRLRKRLRALGIKRFSDYCDYLFSPDGLTNELSSLIDVITTNKTDFFVLIKKHYFCMAYFNAGRYKCYFNKMSTRVWVAREGLKELMLLTDLIVSIKIVMFIVIWILNNPNKRLGRGGLK